MRNFKGIGTTWEIFAYSFRVIGKDILCFTPYPLFQWYLQSKKILLHLSMKCQNSAFNAQGSRVIIVLVQVRAVKICVAPVEWRHSRKRKESETQFTTKIGGKN